MNKIGGERMGRRSVNVVVVLAAALAASGCSFSYSSKSISDSIAGSSESISKSSESSSPASDSKSSEPEALYRDDVRSLTAAYVRDGGDVASFQRGIGAIARQHGISNWEASTATWAGIGEGLRSAAATPQQLDAMSSALAGGDAAKRAEIERAYAGAA